MNLENINRKIVKAEQTIEKDNVFEQKLTREIFKDKHKQKIRPQDKADLLALRLSPQLEKELPAHRVDRLKTLDLTNDELLASVVPNRHYFFLSELREKKYTGESQVLELAQNYSVSKDELEHLRSEGFLDWKEKDDTREELIRRGFLSSLRPEETLLLSSVKDREIDVESLLAQNFDLTEQRINQLKIRGHVDILTKNEYQFLKDGAKIETLSKYGLKIKNYYHLKNRIEFEQNKPQIIKSIHLGVIVDLDDKLDPTVKVYYREKIPVLSFRENAELGYKVTPSYKDISIYLRGSSQEPLSKRELDRYYEILAMKDNSFVDFVPSNTELAFLQKINGRKGDLELMLKIAQDDFSLPKDSVYHLLENNLISIKNGYINNEWIEPKIITDARTWQSTQKNHSFEVSIQLLAELKIQEPSPLIKGLIQDNRPIIPQQKTEDYELFLKVHFKSNLNDFEMNRLNHLRSNGIHPELNTHFIKEEPASWNMKAARKQAFIHFFKERYGVKLDVIEFMNKFKQVTHEQLLKLGLSPGEIDRYVRGVPNENIPFGGKIFTRHTLNTPRGNILYYSIQHQGIVSGRSLLETKIPKEFIAQRPQQRQDLLFHDLKVVDCVLEVKKELESKGYKILEVKNEASQYADAKAGKANDWRKDGPSFMDSILLVEEPINESMSLSGGTKSIAVEYGNYTTERMISKIENSSFDQAFIFSNQTFQQKYSRLEISQNVVFRSI